MVKARFFRNGEHLQIPSKFMRAAGTKHVCKSGQKTVSGNNSTGNSGTYQYDSEEQVHFYSVSEDSTCDFFFVAPKYSYFFLPLFRASSKLNLK